MKTILSVVVGSRLHGLAKEKADFDIRGVFMHPLKDIVSPFKNLKNTSWIEGDEDNTAYELRDFCKLATKGNATILETLWSNQVREISKEGNVLTENRRKFLDSQLIYDAHKGYAHNQYNKMNLFEPDQRTPKFAVAYVRVLVQGIQLLEEGTFSPQIDDEDLKKFLIEVKNKWDSKKHIPELSKRFASLQVKLADVYAKNFHKFTPDIEWIEDFLIKAYEGKIR